MLFLYAARRDFLTIEISSCCMTAHMLLTFEKTCVTFWLNTFNSRVIWKTYGIHHRRRIQPFFSERRMILRINGTGYQRIPKMCGNVLLKEMLLSWGTQGIIAGEQGNRDLAGWTYPDDDTGMENVLRMRHVAIEQLPYGGPVRSWLRARYGEPEAKKIWKQTQDNYRN